MSSAPADHCSQLNDHEPLAGSALTDERILILEQPGAWGRDAVNDSALEPKIWRDVGPCRVLLARHPDRTRPSQNRHWWTLQVRDSAIVGQHGQVDWSQTLTDRVWSLTSHVAPMGSVFVCTNGKRDQCCAEFGRRLLKKFRGEPRLWEVSHLGGHRFAPTALAFPSGLMCGKLEETDLTKLLNGETPARGVIRGRIGRSATRQVAEIEAAEQLRVPLFQISSHDMSENLGAGNDTTTSVIVSADTGGEPLTTSVALALRSGPPRPKSCGKPPDSAEYWLPIN